ncbi:hypothetical protein ABZP36_033717 [Zizania latifolia]
MQKKSLLHAPGAMQKLLLEPCKIHCFVSCLGKILQVPANSTVDEVNQFFRNTLKRHCTRVRPDVQEIALDFDVERANNDCLPLYSSNSFGDLSDQFNNISISDSSNHGSLKQKGWNYMAEQNERKSVSGGCLARKATNPVKTNSTGMRNGSDSCVPATTSSTRACTLPSKEGHNTPDHFNESENGKKAGIKYDTKLSPHGMSTIGYTSRSHQSFEEVDDDDGDPGPCPPGYFVMRLYNQIDDPMRARGTGTYFPDPIPIPTASSEAPREITHNGFIQPQDKKLEFGTLGALPLEVTSHDHAIANRLNSASSSQHSVPASTQSKAHNPGMGSNRMRNAQPFHLKDNGDFPPLSS